jgi:hypothetical protein
MVTESCGSWLLTRNTQLRVRWIERFVDLTRWLGAFAFLLATAGVAHSHHSIAGVYDARHQITVEGAVMEFQFVSPHPFLSVNVA